ncbi:MAG: isoleucine--tRNA ligase [Deltaproteobacteria bacterium]|nr:isoleucine--tRNA ligase [Deltaproteobacteria bacterium]MCB9789174.1 isoleucine--tRNA ligase [Deltaproteobacteria bacterium]
MFQRVPQKIDFPESERQTLAFWREAGIFEKSLALREGCETFVFYEGPPTANGTPHNGHVLTRVIKDLFPRYKTMRGYRVPRKAGWDTHGLPVEVEVEKELGIHGKAEIEAYGVEAFTHRCIASVFRYTDVWRELTERIGFWVDLDDAYVTFHKSYVESVWWALSELFRKGLLYQGHKVVWWWPQGGTALSSGEVGLGYRTVDDPSVTVRFRVDGEPDTSFLGWTTTPWTLPSNCALAVKPDLDYVYARHGSETFILAEARADAILGEGEYTVLRKVKGRELVGMTYQPVFDYAQPEGGTPFRVIPAEYVTSDSGTGVVHTAPAFGEDDFRVGQEAGVGILQLVLPDGTFDPRVTDFAGRFCKEADRDIIRNLRHRDLLFKEEVYRHDYPFCWRADDDPLIQYARPAWFIRTTEVIDRARAQNQEIQWIPAHIKDGRFGDFLANNVDWALSRERYWGTPLNIWLCSGCDAREAPASAAAIEARNPDAFAAFHAARAADPTLSEHLMVHKPWVDEVTFPCASCGAAMHRVPEVIDCWFDSGCMPFAQWGWPHQGEEAFRAAFPADFISEAIDQTRGWFYSLLMVSTLLFEDAPAPHPYRTCIVLGHVCDKTGKKESKSKGNYTPPDEILETDGADAMRWYFYAANPPWSNTRYSADAVRQAQQEFLVKLRNVYAFFVIYANIDGFDPKSSPKRPAAERALLDRWMLSELQLTLRDVTTAMDEFRLYDAAQRIVRLADALSNWYVRRSRDRFWAQADDAAQDKWDAFHTLWEVLTTLSQIAAPFVPFSSEEIYRNLVLSPFPERPESVHLTDWPALDAAQIDERLSEEMQAVRDVVSLGLQIRATHKLKVRQPLPAAEVVLGHPQLTERLRPYAALIADELNVKEVVFTQHAEERVTFTVKPNYRELGPVFGKRMPLVRAALDGAVGDAVRQALATEGRYEVSLSDGETVALTAEQIQVSVDAHEGFAAAGGAVGVVVLSTTLDEALVQEGLAREVTSRIQALRKENDLEYTARIAVHLDGGERLLSAARAHAEAIARETLCSDLTIGEGLPEGGSRSESEVDGEPLRIRVSAPH